MSAILADELVKTYPGDVRALDGLSLSVPDGTVFGLLGPNGAGKTTAVKILTTLSRADAGRAEVAGFDVVRKRSGCSPLDRRGRPAPRCRHRADRSREPRLQGRVYGMGGKELEGRTQALLDQLGLDEAGDRVTRGYSGGMQRRLDIALALVHRPRVL